MKGNQLNCFIMWSWSMWLSGTAPWIMNNLRVFWSLQTWPYPLKILLIWNVALPFEYFFSLEKDVSRALQYFAHLKSGCAPWIFFVHIKSGPAFEKWPGCPFNILFAPEKWTCPWMFCSIEKWTCHVSLLKSADAWKYNFCNNIKFHRILKVAN